MRICSICSCLIIVVWCFTASSCRENDRPEVNPASYAAIESSLKSIQLDGKSIEERTGIAREVFSQIQALDYDTVPANLYSALFELIDDKIDSTTYRSQLERVTRRAEELSDSVAIGVFQYYLGYYFRANTSYARSLGAFNTAYKIFNTRNLSNWAGKTQIGIASTYFYADDYISAEQHSYDALKRFDEAGSAVRDVDLLRCYNMLALISMALLDYERALAHYQDALKYLDREKNKSAYNTIMNNIGYVMHELGNYGSARDYLESVVNATRADKTGEKLYARALVNLARSNLELGNLDSVETNYKEALAVRERIDDQRSLPRSHYFLAEYYLMVGDTTRAIQEIERGKAIALEVPELDGLQDILKLQIRAEPDLAPEISASLFKIQDSLLQEERTNRNKLARVEFETDQYIARNQFLSRQRLIWIGVALGVILLGVTVFSIISLRVRNQKFLFQQQQQEANQEIFNLMLGQNEKIEEGKQAVQKRISEDLHDGVLGEMNGIRMVLLGLNGKTDEASLEMRSQAIEKLKGVQEEIRGISHQLSDAAYQKFHNFILSLEELVSGACGAAGLEHQFGYDAETDWDALQGEVKINLYRIIQECLQNTIRHARATKVEVEMHAESFRLSLFIRDNGVGFQMGRSKKGIGHKNIESRVKKLGGSWQVTSAPHSGTVVCVTLPHHGGVPLDENNEAGRNPAHAARKETS